MGIWLGAMPQARVNLDGRGFLLILLEGVPNDRPHVLYLTLLAAFRDLAAVFGLGLSAAATFFSAVAVALGCAGSLLFARGLGLERAQALGVALLAATSPAAIFHGTQVEVHALTLGMVGLGAAVTVNSPWRHFHLALLLSALALVAAFLAHETTALLGIGWVALVALAASQHHATDLGFRGALLRVAPALFGGGLLAILLVPSVRALAARSVGLGADDSTGYLDVVLQYGGHVGYGESLYEGFLLPLGLLLVFAAIGLLRCKIREGLTLALLVLPSMAFLTWWRVPERGGYVLAVLPFLALLAWRGLPQLGRGGRGPALVVVLLLQATFGIAQVRRHDSVLDPNLRVEAVQAALGDEGVLLSPMLFGRPIGVDLPRVEEVWIGAWIRSAKAAGIPPEDFGPWAAEEIARGMRARPGTPVAFEANIDMAVHRATAQAAMPYLRALHRAIDERFVMQAEQRAEWRIALLTPR
ncbi:MAG: hypothetical protein P1V81_10715 [Planctomycetota bacterium]|nr:hypothetical protein [Planctomycetota bacterium]